MTGGYLAIDAARVLLPAATSGEDLYERLVHDDPVRGTPHRFELAGTELEPAETRVSRFGDPPVPAGLPRRTPRESRLAYAVADAAVAGATARPTAVGTVWASSTAGLAEYGSVCVDASTLGPGLTSPLMGPESAFNGPAATVSIRLGLTGPSLTLCGGRAAGATALVEASRMVDADDCASVLVGASASLSGWALPLAEPPLVPAEGAVCLLLSRAGGTSPAGAIRPVARAHLDPAGLASHLPAFAARCRAMTLRQPAVILLSAGAVGRLLAGPLADAVGAPCHHVEPVVGDLIAAGGLLAVVCAVAACRVAGDAGAGALVVAVDGAGDVVAIEVRP